MGLPGQAPVRTKRLVLREVRSSDPPVLERMLRDPLMRRYLGGPVSDETIAGRLTGASQGRLMVARCSGEIVGWCHLGRYRTGDLELSYVFLPEWWGRGYAREACAAAIGLAFELFRDDPRLVAVTQEANARSARLLEALGMVRVDAFEEFGARQVMYAIDRPARRPGGPADRRDAGPVDDVRRCGECYVGRSRGGAMVGLSSLGRFSEPALLVMISLADGPAHGYAIQNDIAALTDDRPGPGTLYGAIRRLEEHGFIEALPVEERRKPYRLTPRGHEALGAELRRMRALAHRGLTRLGMA